MLAPYNVHKTISQEIFLISKIPTMKRKLLLRMSRRDTALGTATLLML